MLRSRLIIVLACVAAAGTSTPTAWGKGASDRLHTECQDETIDGSYTQRQYSDALRSIDTDLDEYTNCRDVIRAAQLAAARKGAPGAKDRGSSQATDPTGVGGGGGGTAPPPPAPASAGGTAAELLEGASPDERAAVAEARDPSVARSGVSVGGTMVAPAAAVRTVPPPLVVVLALLAASLLAAGTRALRSGLRGRRASV